ncbi:MAG: hypothetical protein EXR86_05845 [Gammaproteobacteria bacterium]|nr:hypothetical protein [Gammaproteobacteria bacterium]
MVADFAEQVSFVGGGFVGFNVLSGTAKIYFDTTPDHSFYDQTLGPNTAFSGHATGVEALFVVNDFGDTR